MNIPRQNSTKVKEILSRDDLNNNEKAILIHDYDYNCSLMGTSKPVNRWDLMSEGEIVKELDKC